MRVTHVITALGTGGAEMMLLKLIRATVNQVSHQVVTLTEVGGPIAGMISKCGVDIHPLKLKGSARSLLALPTIARRIRETNPDLVQGWMYHGNIAATLTSVGAHARWPVSWAIRCTIGTFDERTRTRILLYGSIPFSHRADAIFYNSEAARSQHEAIGYVKRGEVLPNGFDVKQFSPNPTTRAAVRNALGIPPDSFAVGYVGRLKPIKGLPTLFEAFSAAGRHKANLFFVAAGKDLPVAATSLQGSADDIASLGNRLLLLPERDDISSLYQAFDALALTSLAEGFPNVLGEAMASGLPCISTDVGACSEIIGDTGFLVPVGAANSVADAIISLASMSETMHNGLRERARARIVEKFSIEKIAERHLSAWDRLIREAQKLR
jgi:glycosyltransferase involved in cell wall biosynthesis